MSTIASRDLRNHTADVLRRVVDGEPVTITVNGRAVAEIAPLPMGRPQFFAKSDLVKLIAQHQSDPGLTDDLARLAGDTTDDLGPL